jgi:steroid 5-alpha reductase family enzyme
MDVTLIWIAIGLAGAMAAAWAVQRLTGNSAWVDTVWSFATGAGGIAAAVLPVTGAAPSLRQVVVAVLIALWAGRLGLHIAERARGGGDDPRYAAMAKQWGKAWPLYLFVFLEIQAAASVVLVLAVRLAATNPAPFPAFTDMAGIALLVASVVGEGIADSQLRRFGHSHKGAVCDVGLWRYSRHPNYFFEWLGWCAWAVIAINFAHLWSLAALGAPVMMYLLLVHISGIPPLETHMLATRGERFRAYQAMTSAFFPAPRRTSPLNAKPGKSS